MHILERSGRQQKKNVWVLLAKSKRPLNRLEKEQFLVTLNPEDAKFIADFQFSIFGQQKP